MLQGQQHLAEWTERHWDAGRRASGQLEHTALDAKLRSPTYQGALADSWVPLEQERPSATPGGDLIEQRRGGRHLLTTTHQTPRLHLSSLPPKKDDRHRPAHRGPMTDPLIGSLSLRPRSWIADLPGPVAVASEAGPTGFGLSRVLNDAGIRCVIAAP